MTRLRFGFAATLLALLSPALLYAQNVETVIGEGWRVGGVIGFIVENPSITPGYNEKSRPGVTAGVLGFRPVRGNFSLAAGAIYTQRVVELAPYPFFASDLSSARLELSYMEFPIGMRISTGDGSRTRLRGNVGLSPSILIGSSIAGAGIQTSDHTVSDQNAPRESPATFDLSLRLAAEIVSATDNGYEFFVGLAHTRGLLNVFDGSTRPETVEYSYSTKDIRAYLGFGIAL